MAALVQTFPGCMLLALALAARMAAVDELLLLTMMPFAPLNTLYLLALN